MATEKVKDIRTTGPQSYRDLQKQNMQDFQSVEADNPFLNLKPSNPYRSSIDNIYEGEEMSPLQQSGEDYWGKSQYDNPTANEEAFQAENLNETRYENQPWYDVLANGMGKMLGRAGTTFVSSLVGLPYGLFQAAKQGRASALWDNDVTQGLASVDKWFEENLENYQSQEQQADPHFRFGDMNWWADNVISNAGFTLGAAASMAVGSGALGLMGRSLGLVNNIGKTTRGATNLLSALFSATGEGMIEARQGVEERNKLEFQRFDDAMLPEKNALEEEARLIDEEYRATMGQSLVRTPDGGAVDPAYELYKQRMSDWQDKMNNFQQRYEAGRQQIVETGQEMGNKILLGNQVLLTAGNLIQFSKGMSKSFDSARHAAETSAKVAKPFGVSAAKTAEGTYKIQGKNLGRIIAGTKGIVTEGSEEMNQQWIQSGAGAYYNEKDVNDYWKAKLDPEAYKETTEGLHTLGNAISQGFSESWGDGNQWEQFLIGAMTGAMGSYMPSKIFNQDKSKSVFNPMRYGSWEGGAVNEIRDFNNEYQQYEQNINDLNRILQSEDFPARVRSMVGRTYMESEKEAAAENNDKKAYKDADDKQNIMDIQAFLRAGKLDDLREIYKSVGENITDEDVESIIKSTTKEISKEEDKQNFDRQIDEQIASHQRTITQLNEQIQGLSDDRELLEGDERTAYLNAIEPQIESLFAKIDDENTAIENLQQQKQAYTGEKYFEGAYVDRKGNQTVSNEEIKKTLKHNSEELDRKLDSYLNSIAVVRQMTNGQLTKDQEDNLAYLHNVSQEKTTRVDKIMEKVRKQVPTKFLLKTDKTPEQLQKQFASSDLAFTQNENTKKGYVEVDTSAMNDKAFAAFFINNVIGGQNIEAKDQKEGEKESEKQLRTNEELIKQAFIDNAMQQNGLSLEEALTSQEYNDLIDDINDAVSLHSEAAQFYNTYLDYMLNPTKVDQAKAKEEKKADEKEKKEKVDGASLDEMLGMSDDDLAAILNDGKKGKNKSGNKARKAMGMKNGRQKVKKELDAAVRAGTLDEETASDAMKLFDEQLNRMAQEDDEEQMSSMDAFAAKAFDSETEAMNDPEVLLTEAELDDLQNGRVEFDEAAYDERVAKAKDALNSIADPIAQQLKEMEEAVDKDVLNKALDDDDTPSEKAEKAVTRAAREEEKKTEATLPKSPKRKAEAPEPLKPVSTILPTKKEQEEQASTSEGEDAVLNSDMREGQAGKNNPITPKKNWHPWRSASSEYGYYTNEEWKADPSDPNAAVKQRRYDAVRKKLGESGAYEKRKNGQILEGMKVGFKVFQDVNDEAGDFVIFMTDEQGNIIGELPSNDARIESNATDISMKDIYDSIQKEWEDAQEDERKNGMQSAYTTEVDHVLVGKVRYQNERQSVKDLMRGSGVKPQFAIKTSSGILVTGESKNGTPRIKGIHQPKTGNPGQPYVLIPTPNVHSGQRPEFQYYAVPVRTKTIGEISPDTMYMQVLRQLLNRIKNSSQQGGIKDDATAKKLLQALVAVGNVHVNFDEKDSKKGLGIRVTTFQRGQGQEKGVPYTIYSGKREDMDVDAVINALGRFSANISADFINGNDGKDLLSQLTLNGKSLGQDGYNEMIAEIADTNAASPTTVNDWFTVRPLEKSGEGLRMVEQKDEMPEWKDVRDDADYQVTPQIKNVKGDWTIKPSEGFRVYDENGVEITPDDTVHNKSEKTEAAKLAAEVFGLYHLKNRNQKYAVHLWGKTRIYDPATRTFKTYKALEKEPNFNYQELLAIKNDKTLTEAEKYSLIRSLFNLEPKETIEVSWEEPKTPAKKDHTAEVNKVIEKMHEDASHYHLVRWDEEQKRYVRDKNGDYYQDDRDNSVHARVSNVNDADIDVIAANEKAGFDNKKINPAKVPSTGAGNVVDRFVRDFFAENPFDGMDLSTPDGERRLEEVTQDIASLYPNIGRDEVKKLLKDLHQFKQAMGPDWVIDSTGIVASGMVSFDGENVVNVAGTIDLLAYNQKTGQYAIIDMKSSLAPLFTKDGKLKTDANTKAKLEHWRAQQTLYKKFLEQKFGIKINGLRILPFSVSYSTKFAETEYEIGDDDVLRDKGIVVDIHPSLAGKAFPIEPKADVKYRTAQLPESVKRLLPKNPVIEKPSEEPLKLQLNTILEYLEELPEGVHLRDFLRENASKDEEVIKLADILESNKGSEAPVMMTAASQNLLQLSIDRKKLFAAVQEERARKQKIILDAPKNDTRTKDDARSLIEATMMFDTDELEQLEQLPDSLYMELSEDGDKMQMVREMMDDGADMEEITESLSSSSEATRHKKAKEGNYRKLNLQQELKWLTKNLPQVSKERRLQIIKGLIACSDGTFDFGRVEHGIMVIGTQAEEGTVYHEAFHYVVQFLMTDDEINNMYRAAEERYGKMPLVALEERLADDFADYVKGIDPEENKIKKFFRELWNAIKAMFGNKPYIETLFRNINTGVYAGREFRNDRKNVFSSLASDRSLTKNYEYLTGDERSRLNESKVHKDLYNNLSKEQQEYMLHCVV